MYTAPLLHLSRISGQFPLHRIIQLYRSLAAHAIHLGDRTSRSCPGRVPPAPFQLPKDSSLSVAFVICPKEYAYGNAETNDQEGASNQLVAVLKTKAIGEACGIGVAAYAHGRVHIARIGIVHVRHPAIGTEVRGCDSGDVHHSQLWESLYRWEG